MDNKKSNQAKNLLIKTVSSCLLSERPVRKSSSWYIRSSEILIVLNLQKSQWGTRYYINVSAFLDGDAFVNTSPPEYKGDIRFRIEQVLGENHKVQLERILDFENSVDDVSRIDILRGVLLDAALPLIRSMLTRAGIVSLKQNGILKNIVTSAKAAQLLR
jgi:hypothetical protein